MEKTCINYSEKQQIQSFGNHVKKHERKNTREAKNTLGLSKAKKTQ